MIICIIQTYSIPLPPLYSRAMFDVMVPWMSGLVSGLQNHLRRFESARHLHTVDISLTIIMVPWMSGLVSGLQNHLRRFESARHLHPLHR